MTAPTHSPLGDQTRRNPGRPVSGPSATPACIPSSKAVLWACDSAHALALIQPFQPAVEEPGLGIVEVEEPLGILQRLVVVKRPAGEDVYVDVVFPGKGVNTDMTLCDNHETGYA